MAEGTGSLECTYSRRQLMEGLLQNHASSSASAATIVSSNPSLVSRRHFRWWTLLLIAWCLGVLYSGKLLKRGWVPHDEGALAQSADRVLHGELPHRDYTEIYTGGLAYLNAFAFRHLGENLATLRIVLFLFFIAWIPTFYWIVSRLTADWVAAAVTLLAVVWSVPNYSAAVPSWYNLFFSTFGLAALYAYLDKKSTKWLFLAGLFGGLSFLVKTTALYYVVGVLLFFLFLEQDDANVNACQQKPRSVVYTSLVVIFVLSLIVGITRLVGSHASPEEYMKSVVPFAALVALLLLRERGARVRPDLARFQGLLHMCVPFVIGFLIPLLAFLFPYIRGNALPSLARGVFVLPFKRVSGAFMSPPAISTLLPSIVLIGLLIIGAWLRGVKRWIFSFVTGIVVAYYVASAALETRNYQIAWHAAYWLTPALALVGSYVLKPRARNAALSDLGPSQQLFLILAVNSLSALIQYPFAAAVYFCYVAPLVILAAVALLRFFPLIPRPLLAFVFAGFFFFAVLRVTPGFIDSMGSSYEPDQETKALDLLRAGNLRVEPESADIYEKLIPLIQRHAGKAEIYAAPDCPQIYFLAGYRNPTRAMFDFFEEDYGSYEQTLKLLDSRPIRVVVINDDPGFSSALPDHFQAALSDRFPEETSIGDFRVLWRE